MESEMRHGERASPILSAGQAVRIERKSRNGTGKAFNTKSSVIIADLGR